MFHGFPSRIGIVGFLVQFTLASVLSPKHAHAMQFTRLSPDPRKASFCESRTSGRILDLYDDLDMRIPFKNTGGIANSGVCWWHSRFQRALWYLARFEPELAKPSLEERRRIVRKLASRREVVEIPGYRDVRSFAMENGALIQRELNHWQLRDTFYNQAYLRGLSGQIAFRDPAKFKQHMDRLYGKFIASSTKGEILWLMLQTKGIPSHASLLRDMRPLAGGSYLIEMIDSNFPRDRIFYRYFVGDHTLTPENGYGNRVEWVPYAGLGRDYHRIHRAIRRYCEDSQEMVEEEDSYDEFTDLDE